MNFDAALKKWRNAATMIADFHKKEQLVSSQLKSVNVECKLPADEQQQIYKWIVNNSNWLMNNREDYELATQLARLSYDQLFSLSEDFPKWARMFNLGTEQVS